MSSNSGLMNTEVGGENTQYESIHTVTKPHKKSGGQFGEPETSAPPSTSISSDLKSSDAKAADGVATAEKIRFGQSISETGFGGTTTGDSGAADDTAESSKEVAGGDREAAGYRKGGGSGDVSEEIGG